LTWHRKLAFSILTFALGFVLIEGAARLVWWWLEQRAFQRQADATAAILRNDSLNFMKVADGITGYSMKPNFQHGGVWINDAGFHQKESIPLARTKGRLRVACLGESTTFGNDVVSNYPALLQRILEDAGVRSEVINAGVPGWVSDQVALRAEHQLASYEPDVAILYVGWNDFQSYDPLGPEPAVSYWEVGYKGKTWKHQATGWLRSVALLSALYHARGPRPDAADSSTASAGGHYKFLIENLHRIVTALRVANPDVQIFVSTLVGRWPAGTVEEWKQIAPVWWMKEREVSLTDAAALVEAMNDRLREFAVTRRVHLIDAAAAFEHLDRAKLQYDWAHFTTDGYELLAWAMYDGLVDAGVVRPTVPAARAAKLRVQYASAPAALPAANTRVR